MKNFKLFFSLGLFILSIGLFANTGDYSFDKDYSEMNEPKTSDVSAVVTVTMYNAVESQCDADPLITAGLYNIELEKASEHKWVALSRNLLKQFGGDFEYGQKILISGCGNKDGEYTIVDTMNPRFSNRIDILETVGTPLYKYENVKIELIQ
jgi:3D (Asp-Asp-Asp) domain-containing protein